jgi:deoxyribodipyrimidine photo-lyase
VYAGTADALAAAPSEEAAEGVTEYRRQLAWREFYAHALAARPDVVDENYRPFENEVEWRDDEAELAAWRRGETGYPLVDAGMRQLLSEAHVHNRVRMVVASFLTKDLLVDWRAGYRWFRRRLVDHDPANDAGGWQWAAGTGADAQPYFRVFNPATQCERFDPEGEYVRSHVPELAGVPAETIHEWPDLSPAERTAAAPDYPAPIVDHAARREEAITVFERAKGKT